MNNKSIDIMRWTLRTASGICVLFFVFMFISETYFPPESLEAAPLSTLNPSDITRLILLFIGMIGLIVALKWELFGGIISLAAFIVLAGVNPQTILSPFLIYTFLALLFIILSIMSRRNKA